MLLFSEYLRELLQDKKMTVSDAYFRLSALPAEFFPSHRPSAETS